MEAHYAAHGLRTPIRLSHSNFNIGGQFVETGAFLQLKLDLFPRLFAKLVRHLLSAA